MISVSYGGGTNSTALLIGMWERGINPDLILFADTGGEKPHTYKYVEMFSKWLQKRGFPEITTVRRVDKNGDVLELEQLCLDRKELPSIAYGYKTCSHKFKIQPVDKYLNNHPMCKEFWKTGGKIKRFIGYDADEPQRAIEITYPKYEVEYPLIEWDWGRDECIEAIKRVGLPQPGKSACFFCPSSKPHEIRDLEGRYPDLLKRALEMEANAELTSIKGLGRNFAWSDLVATPDMFGWDELYVNDELPCGCYDG